MAQTREVVQPTANIWADIRVDIADQNFTLHDWNGSNTLFNPDDGTRSVY